MTVNSSFLRYLKVSVAVSQRVQRVKPSPTVALTGRVAQLKAEGKDIISLGAGEPDFDTPSHIADAGIEAIRKGFTRYTPVEGTADLKDAIIAKFKRENGLDYKRSQILVSTGAKQTIFNLILALIDSGDEVVIPAPYWVSYPDMVLLADGVPVTPYAGPEQGYKITPAQLEAAITPKTRLFILNSPSNPTGAAYTAAELDYRPLELHALLEPDAAVVQLAAAPIGPRGAGVSMRVLRRFEALTPAAGRARALARLRERWPELRERPGPAGELAAILTAVGPRSDAAGMAALKPDVDRVAARWTTTRRYFSGLASARDFEALLQLVRPDVAPLAVDLAFAQARGADGAMHHLVAFVLELPAGSP